MCQAKPNGLSLNLWTITHTNSPDKPEEAQGKHDRPYLNHRLYTAVSILAQRYLSFSFLSNGHCKPQNAAILRINVGFFNTVLPIS